jgi:CMP-N,N'-diacetyllegionaminic acid synthase
LKKKILALVLARKGSTRLKNKNILKLNGKYLVEWTFKQLSKKSIKKLFVDVLVSTDSKKILSLSKKYKLLSPWLRPKSLSNKISSSAQSAMHALNWYESNKEKVDGLFLFQPTSPFRNDKKIILATKIFFKTNKQVVSVCSRQLHKLNKNSINGSIYLTPTNILKKYNTFSKKGFTPLKMFSRLENIDIDTKEDFERAKKLFKNLQS